MLSTICLPAPLLTESPCNLGKSDPVLTKERKEKKKKDLETGELQLEE